MKSVFLAPGRLLAKLLTREKKRRYRSLRPRPETSGAVVCASVAFWLLVLAGLLVAVDRGGLLKRALDAGVEAAGEAGVIPKTEAASQEAAPAAAPQNGTAAAPAEGAQEAAVAAEAERWLVILHTIPKTAREEAERRQAQYQAKGLAVEIMDTDAFPRLLGGNWIIAQGPFDSREEALGAANKAREFQSGLMVRRGL